MTLWKSIGASVRGPGHIAKGEPNQDAWAAFHHAGRDAIVVSDGIGSRPFSNFGSRAACAAVSCTAHACYNTAEITHDFLVESIKAHWLSLISPLEARNCSATCLFALRPGNGLIHLGMLGDGLVAVVRTNGSIVSLSEDKSQGFSNITVALSTNVTPKAWQQMSLPEQECMAILLCTDGVADDLDNVEGFVRGFVQANRDLAAVSANRRIRQMLEHWPTPQHSDDKTIACLYHEEVTDE